jgi:hypothetical protein
MASYGDRLMAVLPKFTALAPVKLRPLTYKVVPPADGPLFGLMALTTGLGDAPQVNWSAVPVALVPAGLVTVTSTVAGLVPWGGL